MCYRRMKYFFFPRLCKRRHIFLAFSHLITTYILVVTYQKVFMLNYLFLIYNLLSATAVGESLKVLHKNTPFLYRKISSLIAASIH